MPEFERSNRERLTGYSHVYVLQSSKLSLSWSCLGQKTKLAFKARD